MGRGRDIVTGRPVGLVDDGQRETPGDRGAVESIVAVCRPTEPRRRADALSLVVVQVEARIGLAPKAAVGDQPLLDGRGAETLGQRVGGGDRPGEDATRRREVDVEADQVHELERTHRVAVGSHGRIDPLDRRVTGLEQGQGLQGERPVDAVDDEPRCVTTAHGDLAPRRHERGGPVEDGRVGGGRRDHLDQRHDRRRVEEVEADDPFRATGHDGDGSHRQGAGIRRQDRARRRRRVEGREDGLLGLEILERRLDDEVWPGGGEIVESGRLVEAGEPLAHPTGGGVGVKVQSRGAPFEAASDTRPAALDGGRIDVVDPDLVSRLERELGDPGAHRAGTDHADRVVAIAHGQTGLMASNG